ncbi:MAG: D-TA family PLP-dependent enzyme [Bacteroidota bacterium]|nr:D-TA family PLP-dependent enzyme [Bacteroidota bacterium]MDP4211746.1 D-TA family PLP-dependent enzyme [Bacteroidota bacterium]MDP4251660.1 D-TA family PLP-dependent enzyme [Bacteroidota bacterium]
MKNPDWYHIEDVDRIDSPALCVYKDRVKQNINLLLGVVPPQRLRPHVKTHKMLELSRMMMDAGISKFKCATIAEAEMLGMAGARDVLMAYEVTGPKIQRLLKLIKKYPGTRFSCLVDSAAGALALSDGFIREQLQAEVYMDLNVGMNRTGILPADAPALFETIHLLKGIRVAGLHAYDGHIHDKDPEIRRKRCLEAFAGTSELKKQLESAAGHPLTLVAGGSPTFLIHAAQDDRECSPGTFIFWDKGYAENLADQPFQFAALLLCRVVSIISSQLLCVDLGHKSVAAENPQPRVFFLNAPEAVPGAQSEEHLVLTVTDTRNYEIGQVLYGVPWHICPSVALYDRAMVIDNNRWQETWNVIARQRMISI